MRTLGQRRNVMLGVLATLQIDWPSREPGGVSAVRAWLGSWTGVGIVVAGLNAQGYDVELRQLAEHWRANVYYSGREHSLLWSTGWRPTPWESLQDAAWQALMTAAAGRGA